MTQKTFLKIKPKAEQVNNYKKEADKCLKIKTETNFFVIASKKSELNKSDRLTTSAHRSWMQL